MEILIELVRTVTDPRALLAAFGPFVYLGLFAVIFAETGLLVGFFFPGDSLLFAAGIFASLGTQDLQLPIVVVIVVVAAILGNFVGFAFGRRVGRPLFDRPDSRFFKRRHLLAAEAFYEKHGGKTIVLARFLPFVRTFAPIVAGVGNMPFRRFAAYSVAGGLLWGVGVPVAGYLFGRAIPDIDRYLLPIIAGIILVSILPTAIHLGRENREQIGARFGRAQRGGAAPVQPEVRED